ncbi:MAG: sterol desaturase family protein [Candidatus Puniceispirillaceae bacterium]
MMSDDSVNIKQDRMWHFRPSVPLSVSPYFQWPPQPEAIAGWFARSWLPLTERLIFFVLAWASWMFIVPDAQTIRAGGIGWIATLYLKNLSLMTILAGGLHLYLYRYSLQSKQLKFDRGMANRDAARFTFGNQVKDNIFWTLASGVSIWTAIEASLFALHAHGIATTISFSANPVWFVALFVIVPWWNSLWFYLIHRALHWPPLYRLAHHVHHRNVSVGPWSGNAMHPLEHVIWMSGAFIYAVIACNPVHVIFSQYLSILGAVTSHSGYEGLVIGKTRVMRMGDFFHQLHHRFYECNYGTSEVGCDDWAGSFHDGTEEGAKQIRPQTKLAK